MKTLNRLALGNAAAGIIVLTLFWMNAVDWLPNFKSHDQFGPIPHFRWIEPGSPRPTPRFYRTERARRVYGPPNGGLVPALSPSEQTEAMKHDCVDGPGAMTCLRRNWQIILSEAGERELTSPNLGRSYRLIELPACGPTSSFRMDVQPDGTGRVTFSWQGVRRTAPVSVAEVSKVERRVRFSDFEIMVADPSAKFGRDIGCYDGASLVFEADVAGRYRYVARHSCQHGAPQVEAFGDLLIGLARDKGLHPEVRYALGFC